MTGSATFAPLIENRETAPAYWQVDILWLVLADGNQTGNSFSLLEELCPKDSGPPPHTHTQTEIFYLLDGEITFLVDGKEIKGKGGSAVTVPPGVAHSFRVDSETCRLLNLYVPAGFERSIVELAEPAKQRTLPPKGLPMRGSMADAMKLFAEIGMKPVPGPDVLRPAADTRMDMSGGK
ncbi:cupin domain-containing protein [Tunturibacter empetritectus]|uniref:Cupin domain-containing protein n=1 Tax=Tunturiibacter empetritectus TaxID=3069691 RepID=A0AAU7ZCS4_9BACT